MSEELEQAIQVLTTSFNDLKLVARGLKVDPEEVAKEFANSDPDTAEHIALGILASMNPV